MYIRTMIEFKSTEDNYEKEERGSKSNTVRVLNPDETKQITVVRDTLKYIKIVCADDNTKCFVRTLTDITLFDVRGVRPEVIYIFSWGKL